MNKDVDKAITFASLEISPNNSTPPNDAISKDYGKSMKEDKTTSMGAFLICFIFTYFYPVLSISNLIELEEKI